MPDSALTPPRGRPVSEQPETFFDAVLVVSFGGPESMDEVMPFLEHVTRGRGVPRERLEEVAHHYARFAGSSPINDLNRALVDALRVELAAHGIDLPVYLGNREWHPFLRETLQEMADDGVRRALAFFTSAYASYSGCRQYREALYDARQEVGPRAPEVLSTRRFYNHPCWIEANSDHLRQALLELPPDRRAAAHVAFTAHSIPVAMARACRYEAQLLECCSLVATATGVGDTALAYQSRSGSPRTPWLGPDVLDHLRRVRKRGVEDVVVAPIGFVSDHMEVLYDLDVEARELAGELGLGFARASTASTHPAFVAMIRELVQERLSPDVPRRASGRFPPDDDVCAPDCCPPGTG
jgi:ferrochelatase